MNTITWHQLNEALEDGFYLEGLEANIEPEKAALVELGLEQRLADAIVWKEHEVADRDDALITAVVDDETLEWFRSQDLLEEPDDESLLKMWHDATECAERTDDPGDWAIVQKLEEEVMKRELH